MLIRWCTGGQKSPLLGRLGSPGLISSPVIHKLTLTHPLRKSWIWKKGPLACISPPPIPLSTFHKLTFCSLFLSIYLKALVLGEKISKDEIRIFPTKWICWQTIFVIFRLVGGFLGFWSSVLSVLSKHKTGWNILWLASDLAKISLIPNPAAASKPKTTFIYFFNAPIIVSDRCFPPEISLI